MKKNYVLLAVLLVSITAFVCSSFISIKTESMTNSGVVYLDVQYWGYMGGTASIQNTDTGQTYQIVAPDTQGSVDVPYGNYVVTSCSNNYCERGLINESTPIGTTFTLDGDNPSYGLYTRCY
ncbi:hypothetical protein [Rufibacter immobilis]|uniref:hypothetical protein n=1 Tax=Rufibacter immobilis TaxID=1348778 RepID=UPI0035E76591